VESYDVPGMIDRIQSYSYDSEQSDADKAVCGIGTNGIPYLLKWMGYETPTWKHQFQLAVYRVFGKTTRSWRLHDNALRGDGSACALMALGPKAEGAVSNLAQMLNGPTTRAPSQRALFALAGLGKTGLPALVTVLTNQQWTPGFRILVIDRVGALGSDAYPAIPLLQQLLREPDKKMRFFVTNALQKIDPEALQSKGAPAFRAEGRTE